MTEQREKPGILPKHKLAVLRQQAVPSLIVSGGQIENFREGWAVDIMSWGRHPKAHYFKRSSTNLAFASALCDFVGTVRWLYGEGNHPRCKNCLRKAP